MEILTDQVTMIGAIAIIVNIITELTKNIGFLSKVPTIIQVVVTAIVLSAVTYFAQCAATGSKFLWYMLFGKLIAGIIAAYVALYGWDKLNETVNKFKSKGE